MKLIIINGPNLNLLGKREPNVYGNQTFEQYFNNLTDTFIEHDMSVYQSNVEGELINQLHACDDEFDGIIMNPGGFSHTSVALSDAIAAIETPVVEVHISNIYAREEYRHISLTGKHCAGIITGFGLKGYELAVHYFLNHLVV